MLPPFLKPNDTICIISPSGAIDAQLINEAKNVLENWGLNVIISNNAASAYGRFAGTKEQRISDLQQALNNNNIKAILCSRGGYGLSQIIDRLDFSQFIKSPKWLIGYSDITILHNAISKLGIASIHSLMAKHLSESGGNDYPSDLLKNLLFGKIPAYNFVSTPENRTGNASGTLIGGNLSVLCGLIGTSYDLNYDGNILFIEDISEKPYHIDRMIQNLRLSGAFSKLNGLIVGQFSDCEEDPLMMQTIREIISDAVKEYNYPVCFNFPAGHVDYNLPLIIGNNLHFKVESKKVSVIYG
jgi:muramoyltetrapeptide carboxypeptidase